MELKNANYKIIDELINMALTYRISFKNMALLLKTNEEDVKIAFTRIKNYTRPLRWLENETYNEDEIDERVAYIQGYNYLTERKKKIKILTDAKSKNDLEGIKKANQELRKLRTLVDDTIVANTISKNTTDLSQEERNAIAKYRVKYGLSKTDASLILSRRRATITKLESEFSENNILYAEKIERLNDYWDEKRKETACKLNNPKR